MYRKKEWILIGIGILIFLFIGLAKCQTKQENNTTILEAAPHEFMVQVEGELIRSASFTFYNKTNYGVILSRIKYLCNPYSDITGFDPKEAIDRSITIVIPTLDSNNQYDDTKKIQINTATQKELMYLYQIGEKRSEKILDYRFKKGAFKDWKEFWEVVSIHNEEAQKRIKEQAIL